MDATEKIKALLAKGEETITSLAEKLGVTRNTLYARLKKNNWKKSELVVIKSI